MASSVPWKVKIDMSLIPPKVGAVLTLGTMLHPVDADPGDALAAFTEYAADAHWVATHLTQYLGVALVFVGLVTVRDAIQHEPAGWIARLGVVFGVSALTVAAVLQAVDGIALKVMVDSSSSAPLIKNKTHSWRPLPCGKSK